MIPAISGLGVEASALLACGVLLAAGLLSTPVFLFVLAVVLVVHLFGAGRAYAGFVLRGWGDAVIQIEKHRNQAIAYQRGEFK